MDKTSINIGLSKQIECVCDSIQVHIRGVKDFHLYSPISEMHTDLDRVMNDVHRLKRLLIRFESEKINETRKDQS